MNASANGLKIQKNLTTMGCIEMRTATIKIKKKIQVKVIATKQEVKISLPKQHIGTVAVTNSLTGEMIIKQWELWVHGDSLKVEVTK